MGQLTVGVVIGASLLGSTDPATDEITVTVAELATLQSLRWAVFAVGVGVAIKAIGSTRAFLGPFVPTDVVLGLTVGVATQLVGVSALYWVLELVIGEQDVDGEAQALFDLADGPLSTAVLIAVVALGAPLFEELLYRGVLQRALVDRLGTWPGLVVAAVVFAAVHFQVVQFPGLLLIGFILGLLVVRTGRLGPAIWAHVGFNATTVVVLLAQS